MKVPIYTVQLVRSATAQYDRSTNRIDNTDKARRFVTEALGFLANKPQEEMWVVTLDTKLKPIGLHHVTTGTMDASLVHPREIFRNAFLVNAAAILLVHNHPSGEVEPSREDHQVTERVRECGKMLGFQLIDHLIVGTNQDGSPRAFSLADHC